MFFQLLQVNPLLLLPWVLTVFLSIGLHEFCHALAGYLQGDDTAQQAGRLTPNPLVHIDWIGFVLLLLVGFGWGKPTPVNPYNLRFRKWGSAIVALAGPLSNIAMVIVALVAFKLLGFHSLNWAVTTNLLEAFLLFMVELNVMLFVFNLIPIPPLDGSKVLYSILGERNSTIIIFLETQGPWLLLFLVIFGQGILSALMNSVFIFIFRLFGLI